MRDALLNDRGHRWPWPPGWAGLALLVLITAKLATALLGYFFGTPAAAPYPHSYAVFVILTFGPVGFFLLLAGRSDTRAVCLGFVFLIGASTYTDRLTLGLATPLPALSWLFTLFSRLQPSAFLPLALWLFANSFPQGPSSSGERWLERVGAWVALVLGGLFFLANALLLVFADTPLRFLDAAEEGPYWVFVSLVALIALVLTVVRSARSPLQMRRRAVLFALAIFAGAMPLMGQVLLESLSKRYQAEWIESPYIPFLQIFVFTALATIPVTTAYTVLVNKVLDVKLLARKAIQYALARTSAIALAAVPFLLVVVFLVRHRGQSLASLFTGGPLLILLFLTLAGLLALRFRDPLLEAIDRRFFREQYDARQILTVLVDQIRSTASPAALADLIANGVDRALHLENVALLVEDRELGLMVDPLGLVRSLDPSSRLVTLLAASAAPLEIEPRSSRRLIGTLPKKDRIWLTDGRFELLVPMMATDGSLLGTVALGPKRSELPFLREDRQLLSTIASSAALVLEVQRLRDLESGPSGALPRDARHTPLPTDAPATECPRCGRLYLPTTQRCTSCREILDRATVPYVLPGKFRFERRLGSGGMGVVYRAVDLALGRPVAVKTLRQLSPDDALRLRREARTAATVSHPNLAYVYGIESWLGTPLLILEYLERGTLARRLSERGTFNALETLDLGIAMAGALQCLHEAEILHRDVKPTNIGYARDGTPKLMDFGIARNAFDPRQEVARETPRPDSADSRQPTVLFEQDHRLASPSRQWLGTLHYLSPDLIQGEPPGPHDDLWSLLLVLYECLTLYCPFHGERVGEVMDAIRRAEIPDIRELRPDCPEALAELFHLNLDRHRRRRARSAEALLRQLQDVQFKLMA